MRKAYWLSQFQTRFRFYATQVYLGALWESKIDHVGHVWCLGSLLGDLGAVLGGLGALLGGLGPSWGALAGSGGALGGSWGRPGNLLGASWGVLDSDQ